MIINFGKKYIVQNNKSTKTVRNSKFINQIKNIHWCVKLKHCQYSILYHNKTEAYSNLHD